MMSTTVDQIIKRFGGDSAFAEKTGVAPSTVAYWRKTGEIKSRHREVLRAARAHGIELTAEELLGVDTK
jgi:DNA-binding transcriptional regulator YdaS (Cro superfamily)